MSRYESSPQMLLEIELLHEPHSVHVAMTD